MHDKSVLSSVFPLSDVNSMVDEIAKHRENGWRTLDPAKMNICAVYVQCGFNKLKTAHQLGVSTATLTSALSDPLVAACLADAASEYENQRASLTTTAVIEAELWRVYRTAIGEESIYAEDEEGGVVEIKKTNLSAANAALKQLHALSSSGKSLTVPEPEDPIQEAWQNYCEAKARRDPQSVQFWFKAYTSLKNGDNPDPDDTSGADKAPWEER